MGCCSSKNTESDEAFFGDEQQSLLNSQRRNENNAKSSPSSRSPVIGINNLEEGGEEGEAEATRRSINRHRNQNNNNNENISARNQNEKRSQNVKKNQNIPLSSPTIPVPTAPNSHNTYIAASLASSSIGLSSSVIVPLVYSSLSSKSASSSNNGQNKDDPMTNAAAEPLRNAIRRKIPIKELDFFSFSSFGLKIVPPTCSEFSNLKALVLSDNNFDMVSDADAKVLAKLKYLQKLYFDVCLDISSSSFETILLIKPQKKQKKKKNNQIEYVSPLISYLSSVETLSFRQNNLKSIPKEIGLMKNLKKLHLEYNRLEILPLDSLIAEGGDEARKLKMVFLSGNELFLKPDNGVLYDVMDKSREELYPNHLVAASSEDQAAEKLWNHISRVFLNYRQYNLNQKQQQQKQQEQRKVFSD